MAATSAEGAAAHVQQPKMTSIIQRIKSQSRLRKFSHDNLRGAASAGAATPPLADDHGSAVHSHSGHAPRRPKASRSFSALNLSYKGKKEKQKGRHLPDSAATLHALLLLLFAARLRNRIRNWAAAAQSPAYDGSGSDAEASHAVQPGRLDVAAESNSPPDTSSSSPHAGSELLSHNLLRRPIPIRSDSHLSFASTGQNAADDEDRPRANSDETLPQYSEADPAALAEERYDRPSASHPRPRGTTDPNVLLGLVLARSMARLELFCLEILPVASQHCSDHGPSGAPWDAQKHLPVSLVPPPDVCLAWALVMAGAGSAQLLLPHSSISRLKDWHFPLRHLPCCISFAERTAQGSAPGKGDAAAPETLRNLWEQATATPFDPCSILDAPEATTDTLARGLRVCCPAPGCSFSALVPYLGVSNSEPQTGSSSAGGGRNNPSKTSKRGLVERNWRRHCHSCGQIASLDTLVGRKLCEDIQQWCDGHTAFGEVSFEGLAYGKDDGVLDGFQADVLASQLLSPLFAPALSAERRRRNDAMSATGSLGSERPTNSNSLGAAMRNAAKTTFATDPMSLGDSVSWSFDELEQWILAHTLVVNPTPAMAGSRVAGMPNEHAFPDRMGGGFSAGGVNFTADNPYEDENFKPAEVQAREKRDRLLGFANRLLEPYRRLREEGLPSVEHTLKSDEINEASWNNVVLGVRRPFKELLVMAQDVEAWRHDQLADSDEEADDTAPAWGNLGRVASSSYASTLERLRSSRHRSGTVPLKRDALKRSDVETMFRSRHTSVEVRLGRLAHELAGCSENRYYGGDDESNTSTDAARRTASAGRSASGCEGVDDRGGFGTIAKKKTSTARAAGWYEDDMKYFLGVVPRGLLDAEGLSNSTIKAMSSGNRSHESACSARDPVETR